MDAARQTSGTAGMHVIPRLFRRPPARPDSPVTGRYPSSTSPPAGSAVLRCSNPDCSATDGLACEYIDRRERNCGTAWCSGHRLTVDGHAFCRRHAGTMSALPEGASRGAPLPDVDTRAPSLVSWVASEIDGGVRQVLLAVPGAEGGAGLTADPLFLSSLGPGHTRAWERCWRLTTTDGHRIRVALVIGEASDSQVVVVVGGIVAGAFVPPWIAQRDAATEVAPGVAEADRDRFNRRLLAVISGGVARYLHDRPPAPDSVPDDTGAGRLG